MKDKKNIFREWINKIRNRNRPNEGIYYVSQRLRRTAKVVIPELNGLQDSINGVNANLQTLDNNAAKKNTANTFTQKQTFRNEVEFGTNIKMGYGAGVVNLTPEDNSSKTLSIQRFDINMNNKKISNLANPTSNNDAVNKGYVDGKNTEQDNRITALENRPIGGVKQIRLGPFNPPDFNTLPTYTELTIDNPNLKIMDFIIELEYTIALRPNNRDLNNCFISFPGQSLAAIVNQNKFVDNYPNQTTNDKKMKVPGLFITWFKRFGDISSLRMDNNYKKIINPKRYWIRLICLNDYVDSDFPVSLNDEPTQGEQ